MECIVVGGQHHRKRECIQYARQHMNLLSRSWFDWLATVAHHQHFGGIATQNRLFLVGRMLKK